MKRQRRRRNKGALSMLGVLLVASILASAAYAFTAQVTFSGTSQAGDGTNTINASAVSNVHFTLDAVTDTKIASFTFNLTNPPTSTSALVKAKVASGSSTYATCVDTTHPAAGAEVSGDLWTCTYA